MSTVRNILNTFRKDVQERSADSTYTDQDLYNNLMKHAPWLIKREVSAGRIYNSTSLFKSLFPREVIEVSTVPACLSHIINFGCTIYRTKHKLPPIWTDEKGPIIKKVTSIDGSTSFTPISSVLWSELQNDPYQQFSTEKFVIPEDDYLWFPVHNPHKIKIVAFFQEDLQLHRESCEDCEKPKGCVRFLDTEFTVPEWLHAELFSKTLQYMFPSKQIPEDVQIDKNTMRKGQN